MGSKPSNVGNAISHEIPHELSQTFKNWGVIPEILTLLINETSMVIKIESKKGITIPAYLAGSFGMPKTMVEDFENEFTHDP